MTDCNILQIVIYYDIILRETRKIPRYLLEKKY